MSFTRPTRLELAVHEAALTEWFSERPARQHDYTRSASTTVDAASTVQKVVP